MIFSEREDEQSEQRRSTRASRHQTRGRDGDHGGGSSSSGDSEHSENESLASPRDSKSNSSGARRLTRSGARSTDPVEASDEEDEDDEEKESHSSGSDENEQAENRGDDDEEQGRYRTRTSARHKTSTPSRQNEMNKAKGSSHVKKEAGRKREPELPMWAREGLELLNGIMATKHALEYFNEPVDVEALELTDYYDIIKQPMDLGTVSDKLQKGDYTDLEELFSDVRLTFNNAVTYNPAKLPVHKAAVDLLNRFNKKAKRLELDLMAGKNEVDLLCIEEQSDDEANTRLTRRSSRLQHPRHQPRSESEHSRPIRKREDDRRQREEDRRKEETRRERDRRAAQRRRVTQGDGGSSESGSDKSGYMETEYRNRLRARESRSNVDRFNPNERISSRGAASSASAYVRDSLRSFDRRRSSVPQKVPTKKNRRSTVVTENGRKFRVAETSASESGENVPQRSSAPHPRRGGGVGGGGRAEDDDSDSDAGPQGAHYMSGGKHPSSSMPMPINADLNPLEIDSSVTFESIGGLDDHIRSLKESVFLPLTYPDVFSQLGVEAPRGVLFHGPPGTGKTMMARALANSCSLGSKKISFFMRKGADCLRLDECF